MSIVTTDGGLTAFGYGLSILAAALFFFIAGMISRNQKTKISARQLVFCGTAIALAYLTSYIRLIPKMPYGGSVTLFSMLFICLIGYWYGIRAGIMTGLAYGILQFIQEPYVLSLFQVCCDYVLAFAGLGLAGFFSSKKHGLIIGYLVGIFGRYICHVLSGYIFFAAYAPEGMNPFFYTLGYNATYIVPEAIATVIVFSLPPVAKAIAQVKKQAISS